MSIELKIPSVGESITEVAIGSWLKSEGDRVEQDESVVELESEKATFEVPAPVSGVLVKILKQAGETAHVGEVIAQIESSTGEAPAGDEKKDTPEKKAVPTPSTPKQKEALPPQTEAAPAERKAEPKTPKPVKAEPAPKGSASKDTDRSEEVVPMSPIRRRIAERLVRAQQSAALLTTFNEIDMSVVKQLRQQHQESFQQKFGVKLGFMSFFVKAAIEALREIPQVNSEIRDDHIVYHNYCDIGIAIGGGKGLVVPVLRNAERMNFVQIEQAIEDFARRARSSELRPDELHGGTFTITNGGIYGSLLSTPIVNPPQSGVLGMHSTQDRPVAHEGQVVIRPMMYVALTYDHRLVDGREAVTFLKRIKELVEDPSRLLFFA
ncbi:MAG: dihydrolipoyllysine-residue succinyltransferase [Planctomycetaceae bacterium]|nr:dihydrolipoyllysine-residue succinyltransferase [Planctomycetaceae bacterium]